MSRPQPPAGQPLESLSPGQPPASSVRFLLWSCQGGAEAALKQRAADVLPAARPGAWRRGVVTFRLPGPVGPALPPPAGDPARGPKIVQEPWPDLVFARTTIHSLGQVSGKDDAARTTAAVATAASVDYHTVHVWKRDPKADLPVAAIRRGLLAASGLELTAPELAEPGMRVLDCVLDSADRWWVGWHQAAEPASRWPGGIYPAATLPLPEAAVSRAWLKLDEAIALFEIPFEPGQRALELGASPGGACQRLLEAGLRVVGVDPAVVDERVAVHSRFEQWRMRAREVPLRRCGRIDWLLADMNIDPTSTMTALGRIATAPAVRLRGIVATLKLPSWSRAGELSGWLEMFRTWGFEPRARQLSSGGQEVCVVAIRSRRLLRGEAAEPRAAIQPDLHRDRAASVRPPGRAGHAGAGGRQVTRRPARRRPDR
jgi:23S rRNA (cytidine2498-2'-O)-methyltransferase